MKSKNIKTGDIFHAEYSNYYGKDKKHFFYCVYTQHQDINNTLVEDIIGLLITSNTKYEYIIENKNDYNIRITINGKRSYVNADKIYRFNTNDNISFKKERVSPKQKKKILKFYKRFLKESLRQLGDSNE